MVGAGAAVAGEDTTVALEAGMDVDAGEDLVTRVSRRDGSGTLIAGTSNGKNGIARDA
jgi:hypothetical protein